MTYYLRTVLDTDFSQAKEQVTEALKQEGFGILTEIDLKQTLKKKLGVDFQEYLILGACNPDLAYEALQKEDKIGVMLPCNVIVQQLPDGSVEVAAIDPEVAMQGVDNPELEPFARNVKAKLQRVIQAL